MLAHMAYEGLARARLASQACPCLVQDTLWVDPGVLQRRVHSLVMAPVRPKIPVKRLAAIMRCWCCTCPAAAACVL